MRQPEGGQETSSLCFSGSCNIWGSVSSREILKNKSNIPAPCGQLRTRVEGTIRSPSLDIRALYSGYLYYTHQGRGGREGVKGKSNPSHLRMAESSCPSGEG